MIKTWQQRCEEHPDHEGVVNEQMIRDRMQEEIDELRQALDLQTTIERGTKAWADVPSASEWVDELRGNGTPHELKECVHEFFTKYLNYVEETDSGRPFNPVTIGCCRALMLEPLNKLLDRMRELSGAKPNPLYEEKKNEG